LRTIRVSCVHILAVLALVLPAALTKAQAAGGQQADLRATINQLQHKQEQLQKENAELQRQINELREQLKALQAGQKPAEGAQPAEAQPTSELEALRRAATAAAGGPKAEVAAEKPEEVEFKSGAISLQALNPEISVTGDMISTYWANRGAREERWDANFRGLGLHFESYLDPYTRLKAAVSANEGGAHLGEAYFTRFGAYKNVNLTLGKFRQQFGVVNRWHKHGLDQVDFPLPLRSIFGNGGLNQTGVSLDWNMPPWGEAAQRLTAQLTTGTNGRVFGENSRQFPSLLLHYKNYRDLSKDTYFELGLTSLVGRNNNWLVQSDGAGFEPRRRNRWATVLGADATFLWEPTEKMRYRNFLSRTELYLLKKDILAPDGSGGDTLTAWGLYTDLQSKLSRTMDVGLRVDYFKPDVKPYADLAEVSLAPLAVTEGGAERWLIAPYVTVWQSPWVKYRLEYNYEFGDYTGPPESRFMFQCVFAAGPHKHERY